MTSFEKMHNDYLDPDRWLWGLEGSEDDRCPNCGDEWDGEYCEACGWDGDDSDPDIDCIVRVLRSMVPARVRPTEAECPKSPEEWIGDSCPDGDFDWTDSEAGDWHVYACGESDCPVGWHRIATWMGVKRVDGAWDIETGTVDEDGNSDPDAGWESKGDYGPFATFYRDYLHNDDEYFRGWFDYCCHVAETGDDVLGEFTVERNELRETALVSARQQLNYMMMGRG